MIKDKLIEELSRELDMEPFISLSDTGSYILLFDENIRTEISNDARYYLFKSTIGPCPSLNRETFLAGAMEANLFGKATRGAAIGLDETGNLLTLSSEVDYNSSYKDFKAHLEEFVNVIEFWRNEALKHQ